MRRVLATLMLGLWWSLLLLWFCDIPWTAPLRAAHRFSLPGSAFTEKLGRSYSADNELSIDAAGAGFATLQARRTDVLPAVEWPVLHYHFTKLPRALELSFVFRRADSPGDVQTVSVPWPVDGSGSFDLSRSPEWKGDIVEFGFSEFPTAQLVPPEQAFHPFSLDRVTLESRSWRGAMAVKRSDWFGYWPWALMSISALGPDASAPRGHSFVPLLALGSVGSVGLLALMLRWRARRLMLAAIGMTLLGWLTLDVVWLANLTSRHRMTRQLYAGKSWDERAALVADSDLVAAAARVRNALAEAPRGVRVLVDADADFTRARLAYHLLPLNLAWANVVGFGKPEQRAGSYLVLYNLDDVRHYDPAQHALIGPDFELGPLEPVLHEDKLRVFRFTTGATP